MFLVSLAVSAMNVVLSTPYEHVPGSWLSYTSRTGRYGSADELPRRDHCLCTECSTEDY